MLTVILCSTYLPSLGNGRILFEFSEVRYCRFIKYFLFFPRFSRSLCLVCPRSSESLIVFLVSGLLVDLGFMIKKCCSPKPRPRRISSSRELSNQKVVKAQEGEQVTTQWRWRSWGTSGGGADPPPAARTSWLARRRGREIFIRDIVIQAPRNSLINPGNW